MFRFNPLGNTVPYLAKNATRLHLTPTQRVHSTTTQRDNLIIAKEQLQKWSNALLTKNPEVVSQLYAEDATLKPTLDPEHKHDRAAIEGYFKSFLQKGPQCTLLDDDNLRVRSLNDNSIMMSGKYEFTLTKQNNDTVLADFLFIYRLNSKRTEYQIIKHFSSLSL